PLNDFIYGGDNPAAPLDPAASSVKWQDELYGDWGDDHIYGEAGDDMLTGGLGADALIGGEGIDTADYMYTDLGFLSPTTEGVTVSLASPAANSGLAAGDSYVSIENVRGSRGNDLIYGDALANTLEGGVGNDVIYGGDGGDTLDGGDGNDTLYAEHDNDVLIGGADADTMWGGDGSDTYIVTRTSGADTINNFDRSTEFKDTLAFRSPGAVIDIKDHELWFEKVSDADGEHVKVSLLGSDTSVTIRKWSAGVLYQIDFITAGNETYTRNLDVGALIALMGGKTKPASGDAHLTLLNGDRTYKDAWATLWHTNLNPTFSTNDPLTIPIEEGSSASLRVTLSDDITPTDRIEVRATTITGSLVIASTSLGPVEADGKRLLTITPGATSAGTSDVVLKAYDLSGNESDLGITVRITATAKPNAPTLNGFSSPGGTSGEAGGIPMTIDVHFPDKDGSEEQAIGFSGVPVAENVTLNKGWYDPAYGLWLVWQSDLSGLALMTPAGFSRDLTLYATAYARENGQVAGSATKTITVAINAPPTGASFEGTVYENLPNGTTVGRIKGADPDVGDVLTYEQQNAAGSAFHVATDGTVTIVNAALLNHEIASSLQVTVKVKDATRFKDGIAVTIPVLDVNEQNYFDAATRTETHDETIGTTVVVAKIAAKDPDAATTAYGRQVYGFLVGGALQANSADGLFAIDSGTGEIRARTALSYETMKSRDYDVAARDNDGNPGYKQAEQRLTIKLRDINEPNRFSQASYSATILESKAVTDGVLPVTALDDDLPTEVTGQQVYGFWWNSLLKEYSQDGRYRMDAGTGQISVAKALDHETMAGNVLYKVVARDNGGIDPYNQVFADAWISIGDVNEKNSFGAAKSFEVYENTGAGTPLGAVAATDPDGGVYGQQEYSFATPGATPQTSRDGRFLIDKSTGAITVNQAFSYEPVQSDQSYEVIALDNPTGGGIRNEARTIFTVRVLDVNEPNSLPATQQHSVLENQLPGASVTTITATDGDAPGTHFAQQVYSFLVDGGYRQDSFDGRYQIDLNTGAITTKIVLDHETMKTPVDYVVEARDNAGALPGNKAKTVVTIGVGDSPERPDTPVGPAVAFFDELPSLNAAAAGADFAAYDLRDGDGTVPELRFAAGGNLGDWFNISGAKIVFAATFDFEWARASGFAVSDYNGDGRQDAYIGEVKVYATDGSLPSGEKSTKFYLSNVNERPHNMTMVGQPALYSETLPGDAIHGNQALASYTMSDADGTTPTLRILSGNDHGWFTTEGGTLKFSNGVDFSASWLRGHMGALGIEGGFYHNSDNDGLAEVKVATLRLAAVDGGGLLSDEVTYHVLIEDRNEAPAFTAGLPFTPYENPGWYQQVGSIAATDPDGGAGDLRYLFANQSYHYDGNLGRWVSPSHDGKFLVDLHDGRVWVNGIQALDFEGQRSFNYATVVHDRAMGGHSLSANGSITLNVQDVNEPHSLVAASFTVNEANVPLGPMIPVPNTAGQAINLRATMLSDPEGRNMRWQFVNGSTVMDGWQIEQDGTLRMVEARDYEAMTDVWETYTWQDEWGNEHTERYWAGRDLSRAVATLGVQAIDDNSGAVRQADLTLTVADVNEDVTVSSYATYQVHQGSAWVQHHSLNHFWVKGEIREGRIVAVNAIDPERQSLSYSMTIPTRYDFNIYTGDVSNDIDSAHPTLSIDGNGTISFYLPPGSHGSKDIAWQGGTRTQAMTRAVHSTEYSFDVTITDPSGRTVTVPYKVTFIRRGWSAPPIVLDLDGDGLELVDFNGSTVTFDMDEDGIRDVTGWVAADDGLLALDRNGDGTINDFTEISFKRDEDGALTDLEGLRAFDTNANGFLDAGDERWGEFRIWRDLNQDGVSQAGELVSLTEGGIANINLTLTLTGDSPENAAENVVYGTARYQRSDGSHGIVGDVFLAFDPSNYEKMAAPIVLDYDGDGSGLVSIGESAARFDMDGDGDRDRTGWIAAGDALLALDRNGDGAITDIAEISFVADKAGAQTDLEGLAAFDTDGDGAIGTRDERFADFRLWFDNDGNGATDAGELLTLVEAGIASISLGGTKLSLDEQAGGGNRIHARSSFTRDDGTSGGVLDAAFAYAEGTDGPIVGHGGWNGDPTPSTAAPAEPAVTQDAPDTATPTPDPSATSAVAAAAPSVAFAARSYRGGSGRYRLSTQGGELVVGRSKGARETGAVGPAAMLSFGNRTVGYLAPLVLDLDGDGAEIRARRKSGARFDMDGDGSADDSGWIGRGDGFLVIDANGNGRVDDAAELSLLGLRAGAKNSFEALAALDSNRNGRIDAGDARFGELRVWADRNGDGATDEGELGTLAERGIASIDLAAQAGEQRVKIGDNAVIATGSFTRTDGSTGSVADAALAFRPAGGGSAAQGLEATLRALRAGGGAGLRESLATEAAGAAGDQRLAFMVQQMAAFGPRSGEGSLEQRQASATDRYDYFAA
ncbi:MAG TPA: cadherin domain-containing protein, partial [Allosphingosinicella sp.]